MFKKFLAVVLSASMALGLIGCGSSSSTSNGGEIKLGDYKEQLYVYQDDLDSYVNSSYAQIESYVLSMASTTKTKKKGTVKEDSTVNVDYSGEIEVDGERVAFEGGTAEDTSINMASDGSSYIDGFVNALLGHKVGDTFTEKLQFPEDYANTTTVNDEEIELAGKDVWFTFTINNLSVTKTPTKLTNKIVKNNASSLGLPSDITTVDGFREYVNETYTNNFIMGKVMTNLADSCEVVSYDEEEESNQFENAKAEIESSYNVDFESYLEACSLTEDEWREQESVVESVHDTLKYRMIVNAIADEEGLAPSDDEYNQEAESIGEQMSLSVEELESNYGKETVEYAVLYQRVQDFILENVEKREGTEPTTTAEETTTVEETTTDASEDTTETEGTTTE